jgi:hypothetical protein
MIRLSLNTHSTESTPDAFGFCAGFVRGLPVSLFASELEVIKLQQPCDAWGRVLRPVAGKPLSVERIASVRAACEEWDKSAPLVGGPPNPWSSAPTRRERLRYLEERFRRSGATSTTEDSMLYSAACESSGLEYYDQPELTGVHRLDSSSEIRRVTRSFFSIPWRGSLVRELSEASLLEVGSLVAPMNSVGLTISRALVSVGGTPMPMGNVSSAYAFAALANLGDKDLVVFSYRHKLVSSDNEAAFEELVAAADAVDTNGEHTALYFLKWGREPELHALAAKDEAVSFVVTLSDDDYVLTRKPLPSVDFAEGVALDTLADRLVSSGWRAGWIPTDDLPVIGCSRGWWSMHAGPALHTLCVANGARIRPIFHSGLLW